MLICIDLGIEVSLLQFLSREFWQQTTYFAGITAGLVHIFKRERWPPTGNLSATRNLFRICFSVRAEIILSRRDSDSGIRKSTTSTFPTHGVRYIR
jgi:hypothetical protein